MGVLSFIGVTTSSMAVFGALAGLDKKSLAMGAIVIGVGCTHQEVRAFFLEHAISYTVAVGCGLVTRLMRIEWEEERERERQHLQFINLIKRLAEDGKKAGGK